jgi:hypothetical protein
MVVDINANKTEEKMYEKPINNNINHFFFVVREHIEKCVLLRENDWNSLCSKLLNKIYIFYLHFMA